MSSLDVFDMIKSKMPKVHIEEAAAAAKKEVVTAALSNDDPYTCPVCKRATVRVMGGNNTPMLVCLQDRVAVPVPNEV